MMICSHFWKRLDDGSCQCVRCGALDRDALRFPVVTAMRALDKVPVKWTAINTTTGESLTFARSKGWIIEVTGYDE
jgi:hypothetical protein